MTRRAWNNVLVYVVLIIMVVFWYVAPPVKEEEPGTTTDTGGEQVIGLIPDDGNLMEIQIDQLQLTMSSQRWQCQEPCRLSDSAVRRVADNWLALTMVATDQQAENLITDVYFRFVGGEEARIELYAEPELMIRLPNQQQNYRVIEFTASQLLGH